MSQALYNARHQNYLKITIFYNTKKMDCVNSDEMFLGHFDFILKDRSSVGCFDATL